MRFTDDSAWAIALASIFVALIVVRGCTNQAEIRACQSAQDVAACLNKH